MESQKILIDTDVLIDFLRKKLEVKRLLEEAVQGHDLFISVITLAELMAGMRASENEATELLLSGLTIISVNESIARRAGQLRRHTGARKIFLPDCLIAATALEEDCFLLTFNRKDYPFRDLHFFPIRSG